MRENGANKGRLTSDGVYVPTGQCGVPGGFAVGTGPFKLVSWKIGDKLELAPERLVLGPKAGLSRLIIRAIADNTARLQALQTGEIQGYDNVAPTDIRTITRNSKLKISNRPPFNVGYVGINQAEEPFNRLAVRKARRLRPRQGCGRAVALRRARHGGQGVPAADPSVRLRRERPHV